MLGDVEVEVDKVVDADADADIERLDVIETVVEPEPDTLAL